jgi:hypothetical protein
MPFVQESDPVQTMKELLELNWVEYLETPKPDIIVANDAADPVGRFNLQDNDFIIITNGPESIKYRGNITYHDRISNMTISLYTKNDRQKLRDFYKVVRSICLIKKHTFPGWQLIRLQGYQELVNDALNIWKGEITLQLENHAVLSETAV